jgi:hypothetical protein
LAAGHHLRVVAVALAAKVASGLCKRRNISRRAVPPDPARVGHNRHYLWMEIGIKPFSRSSRVANEHLSNLNLWR